MMQCIRPESQPPVRPLVVGGVRLERNLVLAPMAGVTNLPFRLIAREAGAALVFSETVSARGLAEGGGTRTWELVDSAPAEQPLAYQLFGADASALETATRLLADRGARFIDLNLGCPVKKFIRRGAGAALLREPRRVAPLVAALRRALPQGVVSLKLRLGWNAESITAAEVARIAEAEGADFLGVHGRTRAQLYQGSVDRARIAEVVASVKIPVLANGDICEATDAFDMLRATGAAGVMIGRGALKNPWIFRQIIALAAGHPMPLLVGKERAALVERHVQMMLEYFHGSNQAVHMLKKYLCAYSRGIPGAHVFRERISRSCDLAHVVKHTAEFFGDAA